MAQYRSVAGPVPDHVHPNAPGWNMQNIPVDKPESGFDRGRFAQPREVRVFRVAIPTRSLAGSNLEYKLLIGDELVRLPFRDIADNGSPAGIVADRRPSRSR